MALGVSAALFIGGASWSLPACTVVTSDEPLDGGDFDGRADSPAPLNACNECLFQQCSGNWAVCQNQPECLAIYTCATKPSCDQKCVNDCFCAHPSGQTTYVALAACDSYYACGSCNAKCSPPAAACTAPGVIVRDVCGPPSGDAGTDAAPANDAGADAAPPADAALPPTDASTVGTCTGCTTGKCKDQIAACGPASECEAYTLCIAACQDAACFTKCAADHATGKTASQALDTCTLDNCKDACQL